MTWHYVMINQLTWYHYHQLNCQLLICICITRLAFLQAQDGQISYNWTQPKYSNIPSVNQTTECSYQSQDVHPNDQSTVILEQFSIKRTRTVKFHG